MVANRSEHEHRMPEGSGTRGGGVPAGRAVLVLVLFVVITVIALSQIHTGPNKATSQPASSATTSTTTPRSSHRRTTTTTTIPPATVQVAVFNASEVNGVARDVSNQLHPAGWNLLTPANASSTVTASHVYYLAGYQAPAEEIASSLQIPISAVSPYSAASAPISSMGSAEVAVVVGPDLAARASAAETSTTTTAASSATG